MIDGADEVDQAYIESFLPADHIPVGLVSVLLTIDAEGKQAWKTHILVDAPMSTVLGMLEMVKLDLVARSGCVPALNTFAEEGD